MNLDASGHPIAAPVTAVSCGVSIIFGMTIGEINQYLQAGAFVVAIISGCAATYYYVRQARRRRP